MVLGFGSDNEEEGGPEGQRSRRRSPTEEVRKMASKGYSEMEIQEELKDRGFSNTEINRSLNKVLKSKVSSSRGQAPDASLPGQNTNNQANIQGGAGENSSPEDRFVAPAPSSPQETTAGTEEQSSDPFEEFEQETAQDDNVWEMTEEDEIELEVLIEEIIDEKWATVESRLEKFEEEREELREELDQIKDKVAELDEKHEKERERLEEKADKTFSHIKSVESRVGSVEKAFKDFLPALTENVHSLSSVVNELKEGTSGISTPKNSSPARSSSSPSLPSSDVPSSPEDYIEGPSDESEEEKGPNALED